MPHQLEAVYSYFLKLPRIRFLLADDPGAGKTVMAGLLLKELKARGLVRRVLIVTPANLTFQWQRELSEKFRETFDVIRGDVLRANYGQNPWQERDHVITSVSWVSIIEDARESLLRSRWDLIIVDEAHKMSAPADDRKTYAYRRRRRLKSWASKYYLRSGTSVGSHYREAVRARSTAEVVSKIEGGLAELEETGYWLELLAESGIVSEGRLTEILSETNELTAILVTCAKNSKSRKPER